MQQQYPMKEDEPTLEVLVDQLLENVPYPSIPIDQRATETRNAIRSIVHVEQAKLEEMRKQTAALESLAECVTRDPDLRKYFRTD